MTKSAGEEESDEGAVVCCISTLQPYRSSLAGSLDKHKRTHSDEQRFVCDVPSCE
ncbi:hypothetical protein T492DRAFT_939086 [Pavlovales sp. CCMP2436]|nr:hypothetical protein T492DRAFT_939086 [Pavlovales sp. CCMP2436]